jgi:hypothetical protein
MECGGVRVLKGGVVIWWRWKERDQAVILVLFSSPCDVYWMRGWVLKLDVKKRD